MIDDYSPIQYRYVHIIDDHCKIIDTSIFQGFHRWHIYIYIIIYLHIYIIKYIIIRLLLLSRPIHHGFYFTLVKCPQPTYCRQRAWSCRRCQLLLWHKIPWWRNWTSWQGCDDIWVSGSTVPVTHGYIYIYMYIIY